MFSYFSENISAATTKPKKRPYLLKRRALTTSIFDTNRKDGEKDGKGEYYLYLQAVKIVQSPWTNAESRSILALRTTNIRQQ